MKLNRGKSVCDQRWKACLGVLLASALAFAVTHRCGHLLHYLLTSIVLLGGIARYWRPGLGVGDHRPLVVLLRKQVKFNAEVGEAMGKIGRQEFLERLLEIFLEVEVTQFPDAHNIGMVMNGALVGGTSEKILERLIVLEALWPDIYLPVPFGCEGGMYGSSSFGRHRR